MSLDILVENFEMLADAPNGVPKLREMILQLAVRGKLVPQDPNEETASIFLEKIKAEKERLIREKKIRKTKLLPPIAPDEIPYELPEGWVWTRLGNIQDFVNGYAFKSKDYQDSGIGIVRIGNIVDGKISELNMKYIPSSIAKSLDIRLVVNYGDLLIAMSGATTGKLGFNISDCTFLLNQRVGKLDTIKVDRKFVFFYLSTKIKENLKISAGSAIPNLSTQQINDIIFPVPPLDEQRHIVSKVDQLMALCDELEARKQKRDKTRIALNDAALDRLLSARKQKDFTKHWNRISNNFDLLYDNPENVDKLRQAILQLAVQGKLVPQDPKDLPASVLLEKIKAEKERLIKEKKIKKTKPLPRITPDEIPHELPTGWEWIRLGNLCRVITKGSSPKWQGVDYVDANDGILFITSENVGNYTLNLVKPKYVEKKFNEIEPRSILLKNDILMNIVGASIGRTAIFSIDEVANINQAVCLIRILRPNSYAILQYLLYFFNSPVCISYMFDKQVDNARANLSMTNISRFYVPFPPLKEQNRIVDKVGRLMTLCDKLDTKLSLSQEDCDELLNSIVSNIENVSEKNRRSLKI